jgi:LCP family protein required for cell wall assembly
MSEISMRHDADSSGHGDSAVPGRRGRWRLVKRFVLAAAAAVIAVIVVVAGGSYLFANHLLGSVHRIGVAALNAAHQPVMPAATSRSMTVLLTSFAVGPAPRGTVAGAAAAAGPRSGLIMLIHLDANQRTGAIISIPPNLVVPVPGHGRADLGNALAIGGPSLLITTVERLTDVRINHYSILTFTGALRVIDALGGVNVDVPYATTSAGYTFHRGINHIDSHGAIAYARQSGVSEIGRELLQQNLIRSILSKIAHQGLFRSPTVDLRLVRALAGALSVDSNLSNSGIESLALRLGNLDARDGTFVDAPVIGGSATRGGDGPVHLNQALSGKLWQAIRHDSVAAFARRYPRTVTSAAPA